VSLGAAGPVTIHVAPGSERAAQRRSEHPSARVAWLIRVASFAALAAYGVLRWATLLQPAPSGRLIGLLALSIVLVGIVPQLRMLGPPPAIAVTALLILLTLPMAGVNWHDFLHLRVAAIAHEIGNGLAGLPGSFVPYGGESHAIRLVITLGPAVLLLDGAAVLAFAPGALSEARRAAAALPLIALAVVPSTLLRPQFPYLQGLFLFVLLVAFVWGERAYWQGRQAALVVLGVAGLAGAVIAPRLDVHRPWLDYRAWTGSLSRAHVDQFAWNQSYGPLRWPQTGHLVLTVTAPRADYWKAEDLDVFDGRGWRAGAVSGGPLPVPAASALARWSQTIRVNLTGMTSSAVIASGYAAAPTSLPGGVRPGDGPGTWVSDRPLTTGSSYSIRTYSPEPSAAELSHAGDRYPNASLAGYRRMALPQANEPVGLLPQLVFAPFHSHRPIGALSGGVERGGALASLRSSAYGPVYALAQHLAAQAQTPYGFVTAVLRYLSHGYIYNQNPPGRRYPLVSFLFHDRIGYCQQFSGAMALLLRMGGVPARVAAGFTPGAGEAQGRFAVTDIDAHAWVEVWFPRYGWVRFDPTPAVAPARGGNAPAGLVKNLSGPSHGAATLPRRDLPASPVTSHGARRQVSPDASPWLLLPAGLLIIGGGLLLSRLLAPEPTPEDQLRELERALARTGRPLGPEVTLVGLERRFHDSPAAAGYIRGLRLGRYAGVSPAAVPGGRRALREQLRRGLGISGRLRALWALPPRPRSRSKPTGSGPGAH
jgi:transglutaminase-like putative cysteine protease